MTTVSVVSGSAQSATVAHAFANPLVGQVTDAHANPVSGAYSVTATAGSGSTSFTLTNNP